MADDNIKTFIMGWFQFSILFVSMLTFAVIFMASNNPTGLGDSSSMFNKTMANLSNTIPTTMENTNSMLNTTSLTDPTQSYLGSRDIVSTGFTSIGFPKKIFLLTKLFFSWIFAGEVGKLLVFALSGMFGFTILYYIIKIIRGV